MREIRAVFAICPYGKLKLEYIDDAVHPRLARAALGLPSGRRVEAACPFLATGASELHCTIVWAS
jgi:hypothetical protein